MTGDGRERPTDLLLALGVLLLAVVLMLATTPLLLTVPIRNALAAQQIGCLLLPALLVAHFSRRGPGFLGLRRARAAPVLLAAIFTPFLLPSLGKLVELQAPFLPDTQDLTLALQELVHAEGGADMMAVLLVAALLPALAEEVLFRGMLLRVFSSSFGVPVGIVLQAFLFALAHSHPARMGPMVLLGCFLGWAVVRAGSVWVGVAGHAVFNALIVLAVNASEGSGPAPAAGPPWEWALGSLAIFLVGALLLAMATRRPSAAPVAPAGGPPAIPTGAPGDVGGSVTMESPEGGDSEVTR